MKSTLVTSLIHVGLIAIFSLSANALVVSLRTLEGHAGSVLSVAFSPDGSTLASGSADDTVRLWDARTGAHLRTLEEHTGSVLSVAFSPDGSTLASGSNDKTIRLWDARTGAHLRTLEGHTDMVHSVAFSPDGATLASGSNDKTIRLWDARTGAHLRTLGVWRMRHVFSVAFSPDSSTLASGSFDDAIRLWDARTGAHLRTLGVRRMRHVFSVAFSPDGSTLASGSADAIRLWDARTGRHLRTLEGHTGIVHSVAFSPPDGSTLASGSVDNTIRLWDARTGAHLRTRDAHWDGVLSVAFSPDGSTLASGSSDNTIHQWKLTGSTNVRVAPSVVQSPAIGEQFTLSLAIERGHDVGGYQTTVQFDTTALRYIDSAIGDYLPAGAFFVPPVVSGNTITLGATSLAGSRSGDGALATITFEVIDVKRSPVFFSEVILTDVNGEPLPFGLKYGGLVVLPNAAPSSAIVRVTPSSVLSPAIDGEVVFNVDIVGGKNIQDHELTLKFDETALERLSSEEGDYLAGGVGNGDGTLFSATFKVLAVKTSTVSVTGHLTTPNGLLLLPTFESATVNVPQFGDVNRDGAVNILDLVLVASSFAKPIAEGGDPADVNEDGVVNVIDLVMVAGALGNAAPAARDLGHALTRNDVKAWLADARRLALADAALQRGLLFLERLLAALTPKDTALLPNYPNPFNPETWIPYRLAEDAAVRITIYDTVGGVVRQLDLGPRPAGFYTDRSRAAHWDGRNQVNEIVGSGVYFYRIQAGDYSQTRRLVIIK